MFGCKIERFRLVPYTGYLIINFHQSTVNFSLSFPYIRDGLSSLA